MAGRLGAKRATAIVAAVVAAGGVVGGLSADAAAAAVTMREVPGRAEAFIRTLPAPQQSPAADRRRPRPAAQPRAGVDDRAAPAFAAVSLTAFAAFFALGRRPR